MNVADQTRSALDALALADDPIAIFGTLAHAITVEPDGELLIFGAPLDAYTPQQRIDFRAAFRTLATRMNALATTCEQSVEQTMIADEATVLYHDRYDVTYESRKGDPIRHGELLYNEFARLKAAGKIDPAAADKAVARVETVEYKVNLTHVKPLEKLGGEVKKAIDAAIIPGTPQPPRLVIKEKK